MDVTFEGGPLHGQIHPIDPEPTIHAVIYRPPDAEPGVDRTDIPGHEDVVEYIYEGEGRASYVAGIIDPGDDHGPDR